MLACPEPIEVRFRRWIKSGFAVIAPNPLPLCDPLLLRNREAGSKSPSSARHFELRSPFLVQTSRASRPPSHPSFSVCQPGHGHAGRPLGPVEPVVDRRVDHVHRARRDRLEYPASTRRSVSASTSTEVRPDPEGGEPEAEELAKVLAAHPHLADRPVGEPARYRQAWHDQLLARRRPSGTGGRDAWDGRRERSQMLLLADKALYPPVASPTLKADRPEWLWAASGKPWWHQTQLERVMQQPKFPLCGRSPSRGRIARCGRVVGSVSSPNLLVRLL